VKTAVGQESPGRVIALERVQLQSVPPQCIN
jgi:hypothetical protein